MFATLLTTASDTTLESSSPIVVAIYRAFKYSSSLGLDWASGLLFLFLLPPLRPYTLYALLVQHAVQGPHAGCRGLDNF